MSGLEFEQTESAADAVSGESNCVELVPIALTAAMGIGQCSSAAARPVLRDPVDRYRRTGPANPDLAAGNACRCASRLSVRDRPQPSHNHRHANPADQLSRLDQRGGASGEGVPLPGCSPGDGTSGETGSIGATSAWVIFG